MSSNTQEIIDHMELHGQREEVAPSLDEIRDAVEAEGNAIWTRLSHRNYTFDDVTTNRGQERLQWWINTLEKNATKAARNLQFAERKAAPFMRQENNAEGNGTEIDSNRAFVALDELRVATSWMDECHLAFKTAETLYADLTNTAWTRPASFNNAPGTTIVTEKQQETITGVPSSTRAAMDEMLKQK